MRPLAVIGNVNVDIILGPTKAWPRPGTETIVDHDEFRVGGQAGKTALTWQALGVDFEIAANVGTDQFGLWLRNAFGAKAEPWPTSSSRTTLSVGITHPDGERTFFTTHGHLPDFTLADVLAMLDGRRLGGGHVLLCAAFLTPRLAGDYDRLFDWAEAHDIAIALDTGWPPDGWTPRNRDLARHWLRRSQCALLNEIEITTLAGLDDPTDAALALHGEMPKGAITVVKRGPDGATAIGPDGDAVSVPAPAVAVVDTIGAGDVFNAAFLAALAQDRPLAICLGEGVRAASRAISTAPRQYREDTE